MTTLPPLPTSALIAPEPGTSYQIVADVQPHYLFYDTETSGLPDKGEYNNPEHPNTPHLVELAAVLTDISGTVLDTFHAIVLPDGFTIPAEASNIHGITQARAEVEGKPLWRVAWQFERLLRSAKVSVAHNDTFDRLIIKGAFHRLQIPHPLYFAEKFCTMKASNKICGLKQANSNRPKWPKLSEAHEILLGVGFDGAHSATADVEALVRVFFNLKERGLAV